MNPKEDYRLRALVDCTAKECPIRRRFYGTMHNYGIMAALEELRAYKDKNEKVFEMLEKYIQENYS